ncbi:Hypothetical predicted protein [Olea europaea subsp. europaea]|uniref:Uncharacterized protein n=1 Tax=Olea europaea subsp. europaea TaxID=158383 RepID=A0A8S0V2X8_OLEEU|nr:Hypothetical predicted protein [Olea europaea subsp. europaea]
MYQTLTTNPPAFLHSKHNPTLSTGPSISNCISLRFKASASATTASSRTSRWSLHDMTALVTGGTRGIGLSIVEELTGLGAIVHTCARNEDELRKCLRDWKDEGLRVTGSVCDVSSLADRGKLIEDVSSVFSGKLNILINNVGTNIRKPMVDFTAEEVSILMSTNFESSFHMCQLSYPLLRASGAGSIVFTSSVSGFVSLKSMSVHAATKGAQQRRIFGRGIRQNSNATAWGSNGGLIFGGIPLSTGIFIHYWSDNLRRWGDVCKWVLSKY